MTSEFILSGVLLVAISVVLSLRAKAIISKERRQRPGTAPGAGHSVIKSEYFSGGGGGGQAMEYKIPRDPDEYAKLFVRGMKK